MMVSYLHSHTSKKFLFIIDILIQAYDRLGDYHADTFKWEEAGQFYQLANNYEGMIESYYNMQDFDKLESLITTIPESLVLSIN
jgi:hypothetical protein